MCYFLPSLSINSLIMGHNTTITMKGAMMMGRGKNFNHKKQGHEPTRPEDSIIHKDKNEQYLGDGELSVTKEAFKNRK